MVRLSAPTVPASPAWLLVARGVGLPLVVLVGVALLAGSRSEPYLAPFGLLMVGVGGAGLAQLVLERRWERERPGPALGRAPSGAPSTLLVRAPWSAALRWGLTAALVLPLALAAVLAALDRQGVWAALLAAGAAWLAVKVAPRGPARGLHLTPEHLVVDDHGRERLVPWAQVRDVVPATRTSLRLQDGGRVDLVVADLAVSPWLACVALQACAESPQLRAELGTPASLAWPVWTAR